MGKIHLLVGMLLGLCVAPLVLSCGGPHTVVVVAVSGGSPSVQRLRVTTVFNGAAAQGSEEFPAGVTRFGLELPTQASGTLALRVDGLDTPGCAITRGEAKAQLSGELRVDVSVVLTDLNAPDCSDPAAPDPTDPNIPSPANSICLDAHWCWENPRPQGSTLHGVWGSAADNYWAVGDAGALLHWDGRRWNGVASGVQTALYGIWGRSATDIYAVGAAGVILHGDGSRWSPMTSGTTADLLAVWGNSVHVWAAGADGIFNWDGKVWTRRAYTSETYSRYTSIWGSGPSDVWFVGDSQVSLHWDGSRMSIVSALNDYRYYGIFGAAKDHFYTAAHTGVSRWNGSSAMPVIGSNGGRAVWGAGVDDIWVVGDGPKTQHLQAGNLTPGNEPSSSVIYYGVFGTAGDDVWLVGSYGTLRHWTGKAPWQDAVPVVSRGRYINAIWGSSLTNAWAMGFGAQLHWDGTTWSEFDLQTNEIMDSVHGSSAQNVWAVGTNTTLKHYDGTSWTTVAVPTKTDLWDVFAATADKTFVVGTDFVGVRSGTTWMNGVTGNLRGNSLYKLWGATENDVWGVGRSTIGTPMIYHWNGSSWNIDITGVPADCSGALLRVAGSAADNVWAVGEAGCVMHWDGRKWAGVAKPDANVSLLGVWTSGPSAVWVVGGKRIYTWNGTSWSAGAPTGNDFEGIVGFPGGRPTWAYGEGETILRYQP